MPMSDAIYATAKLRKQLLNQELDVLRDAGLLSTPAVRFLTKFKQNYQPGMDKHHSKDRPAVHYWNSERYHKIAEPEIAENLSKAVRNGNTDFIQHLIGLVGDDADDTPFAEVLKLEEQLHGDEFKIFVYTGGQGGGKSYHAYAMAKHKVNLCNRDDIPARAITNSLSAVELNDEMEFVGSPQELLDYRLENPGHIVFVLDEASSFFDSKGAGNAANLAKFVPFIRRLRKLKILPIIVSHRAMDIGTDIRKLESTVFINKPNKETAVFYEDEGMNDEMFRLSGYSTDERYDFESSDPFISWDWDGLDEIVELMENPQEFKELWETKGIVKDLKEVTEELEKVSELEDRQADLIRETAELDYSQEEIAEMADVSQSKVARILSNSP